MTTTASLPVSAVKSLCLRAEKNLIPHLTKLSIPVYKNDDLRQKVDADLIRIQLLLDLCHYPGVETISLSIDDYSMLSHWDNTPSPYSLP